MVGTKKKRRMASVIAVVITIVIRLTVFGADCNLFVVGITFLLAWALSYGVLKLCCYPQNSGNIP